jgi:hypothetical protein
MKISGKMAVMMRKQGQTKFKHTPHAGGTKHRDGFPLCRASVRGVLLLASNLIII